MSNRLNVRSKGYEVSLTRQVHPKSAARTLGCRGLNKLNGFLGEYYWNPTKPNTRAYRDLRNTWDDEAITGALARRYIKISFSYPMGGCQNYGPFFGSL